MLNIAKNIKEFEDENLVKGKLLPDQRNSFVDQLKKLKVRAKVMLKNGKKGYNFIVDSHVMNKFKGTL